MAEETNTTSTTQNDAEGTTQAQNGVGNTNTNAETGNASEGNSEANKGNSKLNDLEALIQRAVDRATNKLGNDNKKLREENEKLKKAKLSDDELKQLEFQEKEKEIAERERQLQEKENRLYAIKAIKEIGLDDGSDASLALVDFVMANDENAIKDRVKSFDALVKRFVQAQVDKTFKSVGRTPGKGASAAGNEDGNKDDSVAVRIGKSTAQANKAAQSTLNYYVGGNRK